MALLIVLILWRLYLRLRRAVGRQHLTTARPWIIVILHPLLAFLFLMGAAGRPLALSALAGGLVAGVGLGIYGLRLTRFEVTPQGLYYTPSAHIGIALTLLLVGRMVYRLLVAGPMGFGGSGGGLPVPPPLTLLTVGPIFGYYTTYSIGLLRWREGITAGRATLGSADLPPSL
jgi:hypothetical protein